MQNSLVIHNPFLRTLVGGVDIAGYALSPKADSAPFRPPFTIAAHGQHSEGYMIAPAVRALLAVDPAAACFFTDAIVTVLSALGIAMPNLRYLPSRQGREMYRLIREATRDPGTTFFDLTGDPLSQLAARGCKVRAGLAHRGFGYGLTHPIRGTQYRANRLLSFLASVGIPCPPPPAADQPRKGILIFPTAHASNRDMPWPMLDGILADLGQREIEFKVIASKVSTEFREQYRPVTFPRLGQLNQALQGAEGVITVNSMTSHAAYAAGTPSLICFPKARHIGWGLTSSPWLCTPKDWRLALDVFLDAVSAGQSVFEEQDNEQKIDVPHSPTRHQAA